MININIKIDEEDMRDLVIEKALAELDRIFSKAKIDEAKDFVRNVRIDEEAEEITDELFRHNTLPNGQPKFEME